MEYTDLLNKADLETDPFMRMAYVGECLSCILLKLDSQLCAIFRPLGLL